MTLTNRTIASTLQDILNVTGDTNEVYRGDNPVSGYLDWGGVRFANDLLIVSLLMTLLLVVLDIGLVE